jgi:hypothetical protein
MKQQNAPGIMNKRKQSLQDSHNSLFDYEHHNNNSNFNNNNNNNNDTNNTTITNNTTNDSRGDNGNSSNDNNDNYMQNTNNSTWGTDNYSSTSSRLEGLAEKGVAATAGVGRVETISKERTNTASPVEGQRQQQHCNSKGDDDEEDYFPDKLRRRAEGDWMEGRFPSDAVRQRDRHLLDLVEARCSTIMALGMGLFIKRAGKKGDRIGWYGGRQSTETTAYTMQLGNRQIDGTPIATDPFTVYGNMNCCTWDDQENNCKVQTTGEITLSKDVKKGTELFINYSYSYDWTRVKMEFPKVIVRHIREAGNALGVPRQRLDESLDRLLERMEGHIQDDDEEVEDVLGLIDKVRDGTLEEEYWHKTPIWWAEEDTTWEWICRLLQAVPIYTQLQFDKYRHEFKCTDLHEESVEGTRRSGRVKRQIKVLPGLLRPGEWKRWSRDRELAITQGEAVGAEGTQDICSSPEHLVRRTGEEEQGGNTEGGVQVRGNTANWGQESEQAQGEDYESDRESLEPKREEGEVITQRIRIMVHNSNGLSADKMDNVLRVIAERGVDYTVLLDTRLRSTRYDVGISSDKSCL